MEDQSTAALPLVRKLQLSGGRRVALGDSLGAGSQGRVFRGKIDGDWGNQRVVFVKTFDSVAGADPRVIACLTDAAQRAARIHHPHVAQTYDFDLEGREPFVVTELVEGGSLDGLMAAYASQIQHLPQDLAILIAIKIADGLHGALSAAQLVHGNVSPRDVLLSWSGEVKVTDFGLAAAASRISMVRSVDTVARLAFVAPEVACGMAPTPRSDVFSFGIILHHMLLGQRFSPHVTAHEAIGLVRDGVVHKSLSEPLLLQPLRAILRRCTDVDPMKRYAHAGEVAAELKKIAQLLGIPDVPAYIAKAIEAVFGSGDDFGDDRDDASGVAFDVSSRDLESEFGDISDDEIFEAEVVEAEVVAPPQRTQTLVLQTRPVERTQTLVLQMQDMRDRQNRGRRA